MVPDGLHTDHQLRGHFAVALSGADQSRHRLLLGGQPASGAAGDRSTARPQAASSASQLSRNGAAPSRVKVSRAERKPITRSAPFSGSAEEPAVQRLRPGVIEHGRRPGAERDGRAEGRASLRGLPPGHGQLTPNPGDGGQRGSAPEPLAPPRHGPPRPGRRPRTGPAQSRQTRIDRPTPSPPVPTGRRPGFRAGLRRPSPSPTDRPGRTRDAPPSWPRWPHWPHRAAPQPPRIAAERCSSASRQLPWAAGTRTAMAWTKASSHVWSVSLTSEIACSA